MVYTREHIDKPSEQDIGEAYIYLFFVGRKLFSYTDYWTIMEPTYATVKDHWHRVASDMSVDSDDYLQILNTPRLKVNNKLLTIERASISG